ncbi:phage minor capsid protein [Bacillus cereus]|uniref:Minor capsid protein n=1 Tax=Bacillus cereus TaxID=1396 RepID=A0A9X7BH39_BACCE|nr:phage minor capsid protein [Bacillus cereus]PED41960.1 minor capsid protein [Bacillus cereus]PFV11224.1 minor capsid protein [Bacillus cereus]
MTLNPRQLDLFAQPIIDIYTALEAELFTLIVKRLITKQNIEKDNVLKWQMEKMNELHVLDKEMIQRISRISGVSIKKLYQILNDVGISSIQDMSIWIEDLERNGAILSTVAEVANVIDRVLSTYFAQAESVYNLINQTMLLSSKQIYTDILNETVASVLAGFKTHKQALAEVARKYAAHGVPALIDKAGRKWSTEAYVSVVTKSTVNNVYNHIEDERMQEYGIDLVRVSQHLGARHTCSLIQGRVISMLSVEETKAKYGTKYLSIYAPALKYGEGSGVFGVNCRHRRFPFVEGLNTALEREEMVNQIENKRIYDLTQEQRRLERRVRAAKRRLISSENLGDEQMIQRNKQLVRDCQKAVREFVREHDLTRQYNREKIYV